MKKILVKSCNECPVWQSVFSEGDLVYCCSHDLVLYIPPDCPLPDDREEDLELKIKELEDSLADYVGMYTRIKEIVE